MPKRPIQIRVEDAELAEWNLRADNAALSLSAWIRERCNANGDDKAVRRDGDLDLGQRSAVASPRPASQADFNSEIDATVARKTAHEIGCDCIYCKRVRNLLKPKKENK